MKLFSLGDLYVSDFLAPDEQPRAAPEDLTLVMDDDTGIVHLSSQPTSELMWGRYWYRSGTNATMRAELFDIVRQVGGLVSLEAGDLWVDIASNDGTLLAHVADVHPDVIRVGVDPVEGDIHSEAKRHADEIVQAPFTSGVADILRRGYCDAKVITCIAMFYDLLDPTDFLVGVHDLLAADGVFVVQMSYTPLMLEQLAFDNICHEHARYYTLTTLRRVLRDAGFEVVDVELNDTNGGSFRVIAQRQDSKPLRTRPWRDVATMRVESLLANEEVNSYNDGISWVWFRDRLTDLRRDVRAFVEQVRAQGGTIWGYGASTKGNTLLQFFGLDHTHIDAIAERQESKFGLRTVGSNIPIRPEAEMREACPDYLLMLPWHFVAEFVEREHDYLAAGGRFIVPCPRFQVIGAGGRVLEGVGA